MNQNIEKATERIKEELSKIDKKENNVYFFVLDTEGYASGSLAYIYNLAKFAKDAGYKVSMLYQTDPVVKGQPEQEFVGVESWLGSDYSSIPHHDIQKEEVDISASDILFIPDIFGQVMNQTKKLPCKRIAIMQNFDYIVAQTPYSAQWGDFNIFDAIANTEENANLLKSIFPYEKVTVVPPFIDKVFGKTNEPKKMVINVVAHNQDDVTRLVKPFYWKYPLMKWVSFRDLRGFSRERFANALREGFLTIWIDEPASFGYSAIEAMKSGNIVFAKIPTEYKSWMLTKDGSLNSSCIWFNTINEMHDKIATIVRGFITDTIPASIYEGQQEVIDMFNEETTKNTFISYLENVIAERKKGIEELLNVGNKEVKLVKND